MNDFSVDELYENISYLIDELSEARDSINLNISYLEFFKKDEKRAQDFFLIENFSDAGLINESYLEPYSRLLRVHRTANNLLNKLQKENLTLKRELLEDEDSSLSMQLNLNERCIEYISLNNNIYIEMINNYSLINHYKSLKSAERMKDFDELISLKSNEYITSISHIFSESTAQINNLKNEHELELNNLYKEIKREILLHFKQYEDSTTERQDSKIRNIDKKIEQIGKLTENSEKRLSDSLNENLSLLSSKSNETFSELLESLNSKFNSVFTELHKDKFNIIQTFQDNINEETSKINDKINNEIAEFEDKKEEITKVLGDISTTHQSSANREQADKEKKYADILRTTGLIGLIFVTLLSVWIFNDYIQFFGKANNSSELSINGFILRFMTITLLSAPFIYMLKESAGHRSKENLYRQRGTQLSSIGAYLDELNPEERALMKKELACHFFGFHDTKADVSNVPDFLKNLSEAVKIANTIKMTTNEATKSSSKDKVL